MKYPPRRHVPGGNSGPWEGRGMGQVELVFGIIDASMDAFRTLIWLLIER